MLFFREGKTEVGTIEPHLFVELYAGEGDEVLYENEDVTQILANQHVRVEQIGPNPPSKELEEVVEKMGQFIKDYLGGVQVSDNKWDCNVFMCRGRFENNLGQWTMRICDFLVDAQGWSFLMCSLCNMGDQGQAEVSNYSSDGMGTNGISPFPQSTGTTLSPTRSLFLTIG